MKKVLSLHGVVQERWRQLSTKVSTMPWVFFLIEFLTLFFTSRFLFKSFYALLYFVFRSKRIAVVLLSAFFLPGVFIHELAHLIVAELVRVKTHGIEFVPELTGTSLKMGSVRVEKSDVFRNLFIGIAPIIVGILILTLSMYGMSRMFSYSQIFSSPLSFVITVLIGYVVFVITNTMFSSRKDVEGAVELFLGVAIIVGALYLMGLTPHTWIVKTAGQKQVVSFVQQVVWLLTVPVGINIAVVIGAYPLLKKLRLA